MLSHKKLFITICLSGAVIFAGTTAMKTDPETPQWKNLKVLPKDISKEDLHKTMDQWNDALGVRCGFCHERDKVTNKTDFASDAKPEKNEAREMYKMTAAINKKYFKEDKEEKEKKEMMAAIACYTCHHGAAHPESTAPERPHGQGMQSPGQGSMDHKMPPAPPAPPVGTTPPATTTPPAK